MFKVKSYGSMCLQEIIYRLKTFTQRCWSNCFYTKQNAAGQQKPAGIMRLWAENWSDGYRWRDDQFHLHAGLCTFVLLCNKCSKLVCFFKSVSGSTSNRPNVWQRDGHGCSFISCSKALVILIPCCFSLETWFFVSIRMQLGYKLWTLLLGFLSVSLKKQSYQVILVGIRLSYLNSEYG